MPITRNTTLEKLRRGELAIGLSVRITRSGSIAHIAKAGDHDWLFIDMEHNALSMETAVDICVAALDTGVTPIVRVPGHEHWHASRVLDGGAMGIVVPHVNDAEQARRAVNACKFPPVGHRSVMGGYAQLGFEAVPISEATRLMNENTLLAVMIETPEAVENVDAIAAVDGVDVVYVGSNDLLAEMGMHGQFASPELEEIGKKVVAACQASGKIPGIGGVRDPELCAKFLRMGSRFLTTQTDLAFLIGAAKARAEELRAIAVEAG